MMTDHPDDEGIPLAPVPETPPFSPMVPEPAPPWEAASPGLAERAKRRIPTDVGALFMILAAVGVVFPLLARQKLDHSPNDASRWNTIYYLVEHGTYEYKPDWTLPWNGGKGKTSEQLTPEQRDKWIPIGDKYYNPDPSKGLWGIAPFFTIDMVKIGDKYYSSKPPLLSTCLAGVVWGLQKISGYHFRDHPYFIMRATVILTQVVPFLIMVWLTARFVRRQSDSPFVRNFCIAAAALATYLTPYLIPLNNHVIAACTAMFATYATMRVWYDGKRQWYWFALAGFFAAFTAALETPAAVFAVLVFVALLYKSPKKTLVIGLPLALIPAVAAVYTNYLVTGSLEDAFKPMPLRIDEEGGPYFYPGSYWHENKYCGGPTGMDALEEPQPTYLMHMLIGHHGFFLLTPVFLISLLGIFAHWLRHDERARPLLALFVFVLSAVVVAALTKNTHNYGGTCQGFRWLFWLIPLWLLMLPAGVEVLARARLGRFICVILFCVSLISAAWALPQVDGKTVPPFSDSWAHQLFRELPWKSIKINY